MKKVLLSALTVAMLVFTACENGDKNATVAEITDAKAVEQPDAAAVTYVVDTNASSFSWEGHKKLNIGDSHKGTVRLKESTVMIVTGNKVTSGTFVMDMKSIKNLDLKGSDEKQAKLVGHLKSADFFDVAKYPTSKFEITSVKDSVIGDNNVWLEGNLTIKEKTQNIGFPAVITVNENKATAKARVIIDRSKFDVQYGSENFFKDLAGDKVISNDITLDIDLVANRQDANAAAADHNHAEDGHTH
ncbi:MAG: YceI family protein [Bacteroidia bacterium]